MSKWKLFGFLVALVVVGCVAIIFTDNVFSRKYQEARIDQALSMIASRSTDTELKIAIENVIKTATLIQKNEFMAGKLVVSFTQNRLQDPKIWAGSVSANPTFDDFTEVDQLKPEFRFHPCTAARIGGGLPQSSGSGGKIIDPSQSEAPCLPGKLILPGKGLNIGGHNANLPFNPCTIVSPGVPRPLGTDTKGGKPIDPSMSDEPCPQTTKIEPRKIGPYAGICPDGTTGPGCQSCRRHCTVTVHCTHHPAKWPFEEYNECTDGVKECTATDCG
jgi:hypothetical protein